MSSHLPRRTFVTGTATLGLADLVMVDAVEQREAAASVLRSFVIEDGRPGAQQV